MKMVITKVKKTNFFLLYNKDYPQPLQSNFYAVEHNTWTNDSFVKDSIFLDIIYKNINEIHKKSNLEGFIFYAE